MDKFKLDLEKGKKAENYICKFIQKYFPDAHVFDGYKKEWDIEVPSREVTIEVKYDRLSKKTGNLAIEFEYFGNPSGVEATTADIWCIIFGKSDGWHFAFVTIEKLKSACQGHRVVDGGDDRAAKMYLLPVESFLEIENLTIYPVDKFE